MGRAKSFIWQYFTHTSRKNTQTCIYCKENINSRAPKDLEHHIGFRCGKVSDDIKQDVMRTANENSQKKGVGNMTTGRAKRRLTTAEARTLSKPEIEAGSSEKHSQQEVDTQSCEVKKSAKENCYFRIGD